MKKTKIRLPRLTKRQLIVSVTVVVAIAVIVAGYLSGDGWLPKASQLLAAAQERLHGSEGDQNPADDALTARPTAMPAVAMMPPLRQHHCN